MDYEQNYLEWLAKRKTAQEHLASILNKLQKLANSKSSDDSDIKYGIEESMQVIRDYMKEYDM